MTIMIMILRTAVESNCFFFKDVFLYNCDKHRKDHFWRVCTETRTHTHAWAARARDNDTLKGRAREVEAHLKRKQKKHNSINQPNAPRATTVYVKKKLLQNNTVSREWKRSWNTYFAITYTDTSVFRSTPRILFLFANLPDVITVAFKPSIALLPRSYGL